MKKIAYTLIFLILFFCVSLFFLQRNVGNSPSDSSGGDIGRGKVSEKSKSIEGNAPNLLGSETINNILADEVTDLVANSSSELKIGEKSYPVEFENNTLKEIKEVILNEIKTIYGHLNVEIKERNNSIRFGEVLYSNFKEINFHGKGRFRPDAYRGFGKLINLNGTEHVIVPKKLIKAYEDAYALKEKHRVAYQELDKFVRRLNNLKNEPAHELLFVPQEMGGSKILSPDVVDSWANEYQRGSLLYFNKSKVKSLELDEPLIAEIVLVNNGIPQGIHDIVYINGKGWRLFIPVL